MSGGYTYTAITAAVDEPIRIEVSIFPDDATQIRVFGGKRDRPQLNIRHGDVDVTFAAPRDRVTEKDARIARDLANQASAYAAEVERLYAEHDAKAAADTAA